MLTSTFNHLLTHPGRGGDQLLLYFIVFNQITMLQK
ncbi:PTK2 protein tyrosine kinase 2, isoform CRA_a [Rattus norvegicus]|uniref:PTK2 protein tyrosine kinase 2, isoform CRA_a n=1 Tax=Rattus norvegicus TaxID=10116 RepID=A6HRV5_RAT|nr:PTK2 protein tyrosine kinase 2, isoform CRA_a [Rattus norvegicus]